jgi:flotillin
MSIDEINADREKFESTIRHNAEKELNKVGLVLINVNITNIEDDSGLIEAMGKKATAEVVQKALVDVAIAERHGAIGQAEQERDKNIGVAKNIQESSVKTAEFNALQVRGENISKQSIANSNSELQVAEAEAYKIGEIKQRQGKIQ